MRDYSIDAGGDVYVAGCNPEGKPWSIGIRHPRCDDQLIDSLRVVKPAVCTSGDYERRNADDGRSSYLAIRAAGRRGRSWRASTVLHPRDGRGRARDGGIRPGSAAGIRLLERRESMGSWCLPNVGALFDAEATLSVPVRRFFRTPKGLLTIILAMLIAMAPLGQTSS